LAESSAKSTVRGATGAAVAGPPAAPSQSSTFAVDCNRGQKIAQALQLGDFRKPVVIKVRGTCRDFVTIARANVTLRGDPAAEIVAPHQDSDLLTVTADQVALENLTLTGGLTDLAQEHAPTFTATKVVVRDTSGVDVCVRVGDARLLGCTVQGSGGAGVSVVRGGSVVLSNGSEIMDNRNVGIEVSGAASASYRPIVEPTDGGSGANRGLPASLNARGRIPNRRALLKLRIARAQAAVSLELRGGHVPLRA
jgi:hypothetical protein